AGLFLVLFRWLTVRPVGWRDALPGAVISAVILQVLQTGASLFINHQLKGASTTYGKDVAGVIVLMSWFYLQAQVVLLSAEVNVVRHYQRSEEHTSELQSLAYLVCRLLLEKKNYAESQLSVNHLIYYKQRSDCM